MTPDQIKRRDKKADQYAAHTESVSMREVFLDGYNFGFVFKA